MEKLGYAILGLGIGMAHAEGVAASEHAELVAACDLDRARLDKFHALYPHAALTEDFEALLKNPDVDIISICLPSAMHADFAVRAMEAGKHVLVEKPIDITVERAARIEEARRRTGRICGVVHQNRFNLNMVQIKRAVDEGKLGRLLLGTFAVKWYRDQRYYDRGGWRGTWEMDGGGSLMNQAVHTVDLMRYLMGEVESVYSTMDICNHKISTEDLTASVIRLRSGATATFVSTTCAYPGICTEVDLYGTEGSVEADADVLRTWKFKSDEDEEEEERMLARYGSGNKAALAFHPGALYGHRHVVEDMICAVRDGRAPEVLPADAIESVRIVEAIYTSAKKRCEVVLGK